MKKIWFFLILGLVCTQLFGCSEEIVEKTYQCPIAYPFFNVYDLKCYTSEEAAEEANKYQQQED